MRNIHTQSVLVGDNRACDDIGSLTIIAWHAVQIGWYIHVYTVVLMAAQGVLI